MLVAHLLRTQTRLHDTSRAANPHFVTTRGGPPAPADGIGRPAPPTRSHPTRTVPPRRRSNHPHLRLPTRMPRTRPLRRPPRRGLRPRLRPIRRPCRRPRFQRRHGPLLLRPSLPHHHPPPSQVPSRKEARPLGRPGRLLRLLAPARRRNPRRHAPSPEEHPPRPVRRFRQHSQRWVRDRSQRLRRDPPHQPHPFCAFCDLCGFSSGSSRWVDRPGPDAYVPRPILHPRTPALPGDETVGRPHP